MPIELQQPQNEHDRNLGIGWDAEKVGKAIREGNDDTPEIEQPFCMRDYFFANFKQEIKTITGAL